MKDSDNEFLNSFLRTLEDRRIEADLENFRTAALVRSLDEPVRCVVCGIEKGESDMTKIFRTWENGKISQSKGICKRCWNFDPTEDL